MKRNFLAYYTTTFSTVYILKRACNGYFDEKLYSFLVEHFLLIFGNYSNFFLKMIFVQNPSEQIQTKY